MICLILFLMNPYVRSLLVCNPIVSNMREVQVIRVPAEVDEEFPPNNNEMEEEISESRVGEQGLVLCEDCQAEERNLDCLCCDKEASITDKKFDGM